VLVVGGGNAGLCAAIAARQAGASVLLLEQAPTEMRGGSSRHGRNLRLAHDFPTAYQRETYTEAAFWDDLVRVTGADTDEALARLAIAETAGLADWMQRCGVEFQLPPRGALPPSRKTAFLLGGGKALLNAYYRTAERLGVRILYNSGAASVRPGADECEIISHGMPRVVQAKSVVLACGGPQANIGWLRQHLGEVADGLVVRGSSDADGRVMFDLLAQGAAPVGDPTRCHIVAVDGRAPAFDGGIVTRLDCVPYSIVVDRHGRRFHDEAASIGPERYAIWGELVARCPGQIAHAIFDATAETLFRPSIFPPIRAATLAGLAEKLAIDPGTLIATVEAFNQAVSQDRTAGHTPPKTRLARKLLMPPFSSTPMRPGITFAAFGLRVDAQARVLMSDGQPAANIFAAGLIMAANVLGRGYLAGMGLTIGTIFGRIAGRQAAEWANVSWFKSDAWYRDRGQFGVESGR